jgi:hypothetical protein
MNKGSDLLREFAGETPKMRPAAAEKAADVTQKALTRFERPLSLPCRQDGFRQQNHMFAGNAVRL